MGSQKGNHKWSPKWDPKVDSKNETPRTTQVNPCPPPTPFRPGDIREAPIRFQDALQLPSLPQGGLQDATGATDPPPPPGPHPPEDDSQAVCCRLGGINSGPTWVPYQTEMRPNSGQPRGDLAARLTRSSRHTKQKRAQTTRAARKTKETQARNTSRARNQRRIDGQRAPPKSHEKLHVTKRQTHDTVLIRKEGEGGHRAHFHRQTHAHIRICKYVKPGTHRHRA